MQVEAISNGTRASVQPRALEVPGVSPDLQVHLAHRTADVQQQLRRVRSNQIDSVLSASPSMAADVLASALPPLVALSNAPSTEPPDSSKPTGFHVASLAAQFMTRLTARSVRFRLAELIPDQLLQAHLGGLDESCRLACKWGQPCPDTAGCALPCGRLVRVDVVVLQNACTCLHGAGGLWRQAVSSYTPAHPQDLGCRVSPEAAFQGKHLSASARLLSRILRHALQVQQQTRVAPSSEGPFAPARTTSGSFARNQGGTTPAIQASVRRHTATMQQAPAAMHPGLAATRASSLQQPVLAALQEDQPVREEQAAPRQQQPPWRDESIQQLPRETQSLRCAASNTPWMEVSRHNGVSPKRPAKPKPRQGDVPWSPDGPWQE